MPRLWGMMNKMSRPIPIGRASCPARMAISIAFPYLILLSIKILWVCICQWIVAWHFLVVFCRRLLRQRMRIPRARIILCLIMLRQWVAICVLNLIRCCGSACWLFQNWGPLSCQRMYISSLPSQMKESLVMKPLRIDLFARDTEPYQVKRLLRSARRNTPHHTLLLGRYKQCTSVLMAQSGSRIRFGSIKKILKMYCIICMRV